MSSYLIATLHIGHRLDFRTKYHTNKAMNANIPSGNTNTNKIRLATVPTIISVDAEGLINEWISELQFGHII